MNEGFDWEAALAFGLGRLRLPPDRFWAMTPRELAAAAVPSRPTLGPPPDRNWLDDAVRRFPDAEGAEDIS